MVEITDSDVVILDEVVNNNEGMAAFLMFVYTKNPTDVLDRTILQVHIYMHVCNTLYNTKHYTVMCIAQHLLEKNLRIKE